MGTNERDVQILTSLMNKYINEYLCEDGIFYEKRFEKNFVNETLFSPYNSIMQKISLAIGIIIFLNWQTIFMVISINLII